MAGSPFSWLSAFPPQPLHDFREPGRAHLVGIAGAGMRSLAQVLLEKGWKLSGSDPSVGAIALLAEAGVALHDRHDARHLPRDCDLVIYSDAIPPTNPELALAGRLHIPAISYSVALGRLMTEKRGLAIAGMHGKSTTAAMAADILTSAGLDPAMVYGAAPPGRLTGGRWGQGELMLVEACADRANFLKLRPSQAVILGIEPGHFDGCSSRDRLEHAFALFARSVSDDGLVLARGDCPSTRRATSGLRCRVETFGLDASADWSASGLRARRGIYQFDVVHRGRLMTRVKLCVPGRHQVLNALAATALAWHNGVPLEKISQALGGFRGLQRRLEVIGVLRGAILIDDCARHPTEVAATLRTIRQMYPAARQWCVFRPHQVSRSGRLLDELAASLQNADKVLIAEISRSPELPREEGVVRAVDLVAAMGRCGGDTEGIYSIEGILGLLENRLRPGDVLVTIGAGDIRKVADGLVYRFREDCAAG